MREGLAVKKRGGAGVTVRVTVTKERPRSSLTVLSHPLRARQDDRLRVTCTSDRRRQLSSLVVIVTPPPHVSLDPITSLLTPIGDGPGGCQRTGRPLTSEADVELRQGALQRRVSFGRGLEPEQLREVYSIYGK